MGPNFREILPLLIRHKVRFIVIGGGAAIAHGLARTTYDVDVVFCARRGKHSQPGGRSPESSAIFRW